MSSASGLSTAVAKHQSMWADQSETSGKELPGSVRSQMEGQLGADLGGVRIHTDSGSASTASRLGATAFTHGRDIHFADGSYAPGSKDGDHLLAHELTHVVQQGEGAQVQRKAAAGQGAMEVSHEGERAEVAADAIADSVTANLHAGGNEVAGQRAPARQSAQGAHGAGSKVFLARPRQATADAPLATSRAARREAMRRAGVPTSQQPISQARNSSGRSYEYQVATSGGGSGQVSVQQQTMDRSHQGEPHWEAGRVKMDPVHGGVRMTDHDRPKLTNDKAKVNYNE
jgi:hypothetical protein